MSDGYEYSYTFDGLHFEIPGFNKTVTLPPPIPVMLGFGSVVVYLFLIFVLFPMFRPTSDWGKSALKSGAKFHFAVLFLYSAGCCILTFRHLILTGEFYSFQAYMCNPLPGYLRLVSLTFTLSKVVEWGDTAVDIWKGRTPAQIGFLHCYHHATTFLLFLLVINFPGTEKAGMLLNGFVHTLMYYHYAFRLPKFARPIITALQIVQLISVTYLWYATPDTCPAHASFIEDHTLEFYVPYALVPVYALFFIRFFIESYIIKPKQEKKRRGSGLMISRSSDALLADANGSTGADAVKNDSRNGHATHKKVN